MTKNVLISITGLQFDHAGTPQDEAIEVVCHGTYSFKKGTHILKYDDISDVGQGNTITSKCTVSFNSTFLELEKRGDVNAQLLFEEGKSHARFYNTEYGDFCISTNTQLIDIKETTEQIDILLRYDLDVNYQHVSENTLTIKICSLNSNTTE